MGKVRAAVWLIWGAYGALALAIGLFAGTIALLRPDVGWVFSATLLLGIAGTTAGLVLLGASLLGIRAMVREPASRTPGAVITVLAGLIGAAFLGWTAGGFWTG